MGHVAPDEVDIDAGSGSVAAGDGQRFWDHVEAGNLPAVPGQIDAVGAGPTAQVKRATGCECVWTLDELDQVRRWLSALPDGQPNQIEGAVDQAVPASG